MRRILIPIFAAFISFAASAQMLPDSTVQVCAYWDKGDKVTYKCTSKKAEIGPNGIENVTQTLSEKRIFEVTGETKKAYTLVVSYKDTERSDANGVMGEIPGELNRHFVIKLKTDEFGTVQEITNRMEDAAVEDACMKDVMPLLMYHGARMRLNERYSSKQQLASAIGNGYIEADMSFWVDREESDSAFVVLRSISTAGKDVFAPIAKEAARNNVIATFPPEAQAGALARIDEMLKTMDFSMIKNTVTIVHLASGWTTYYKSECHMKITDENGTKDTVFVEEFTLDDCE